MTSSTRERYLHEVVDDGRGLCTIAMSGGPKDAQHPFRWDSAEASAW